MTPPAAVAERADTAADVLTSLRERLSASERNRFDLELLDTARREPDRLRHLLESWMVTIVVREHPDYEDQYKSFVRYAQDCDLPSGA